MRQIRPAPKAAKDQLMVAKPGVAPAKTPPRALPLAPKVGPASTRDYGKQPPQINPAPGLPGEGI